MERRLANFTWEEIRDLDKRAGVVVLPIGATEQHGPHLPLGTDTLLATGVLERALAHLPETVPTWVLPPLPYGKSTEHAGFPGTLSLSARTLLSVLEDLARGVAAAGFRRLAFLNGHGGNRAVLDIAARDLRAETGLLCFCLHPGLLVPPDAATPEPERHLGLHAGALETSLMLALAAEGVRMERADPALPTFPEGGVQLTGEASVGWLTRDWSESGALGDARDATRERGDALLEAASRRLADLITEISTFEVAHG